jgi:hypothetical protein
LINPVQRRNGGILQFFASNLPEVFYKKIYNGEPEIVFALEIIVKRSFGHSGGGQNFLNTGVVEPFTMDNGRTGLYDPVSGI